MTLAQLQAFVTIVEVGSFTLASEVLGMTQSAVSHAMASLEAELGIPLLQRERSGLTLTAAGQRILPQAKEMLARAEAIRQEAAAAQGVETGKLRLGSFPSVSTRFLPGVLRRFRQRYPHIEVILFEGTDQEVKAWIEARTIDIGVVTLPQTDVDVIPIACDEWLAVVPADHPLARKRTVSLAQLAQEPFLMSKSGCEPILTALFRKAGVMPQVQFGVRETPTLLAMVQEGMGVSIVAEWNLSTELSGLTILHLRPAVFRPLALAVPSLALASPAVQAFLEQAQQWATEQGLLQEESPER